MKIAIPLFGTRISPRLDCAKKVLLVSVEEKERKVLSSEEKIFETAVAGENTDFFVSNNIDAVVCGGISIEMQDLLIKHKIEVFSWVTGEADKALELFLEGKLVSGAMLCPGMRVKRWLFCSQGRAGNPRALKK